MKKIITYLRRLWNNQCQKCGSLMYDFRGVNSCYLCDLTPPDTTIIKNKTTFELYALKRELEESEDSPALSEKIKVIITELKRRHNQA